MSAAQTGYVAAEGFSNELEAELSSRGSWTRLTERLYLQPGPAQQSAWAADIWFDLRSEPVTSISAAAQHLRAQGPWWGLLPGAAYRRSVLISDKLPKRRWPDQVFPPQRRLVPLGGYTLSDRDTMWWAAETMRPWPGGTLQFVENREDPPSRAYRKLWEAFSLLDRWPDASESCWDLGAAPGAWTWVLAALGAEVRSIDRAPLADAIAALPRVSHRQGNAFAIDPVAEATDWLCSDVICYPDRLADCIASWQATGRTRKFVITVKFQGPPKPEDLDFFKAQANSVITHLHHNKHEVTWMCHPELRFGPWPLCSTVATQGSGLSDQA